MKFFLSKINKFKRPLSLFLSVCIVLGSLFTTKTNVAKADEEQTYISSIGNTKYFRYINPNGVEADLSVPLYKNSQGEIVYCIELEASSPASNILYSKNHTVSYLNDTLENGIRSILQWGYPMNENFASNYGLTQDEAISATAVAIKKYLSANEVYHSGYTWNFDEGLKTKSGYENVYNGMNYLYEQASNNISYKQEKAYINFIERTSDKYYYYFKYDIPQSAEINVEGIENYRIIKNDDETITVKVPKFNNYGASGNINITVFGNNSPSGISYISPESGSYQHMVIAKPNFGIADTSEIDLTIPTSGKVTIYKSDSTNGNPLSGAIFGVYCEASCENLAGYIETDSTGYGSLDVDEDVTVYYVKELFPPAGYSLGDTSAKTVLFNGTVNFENDKILSTIGVHKIASDTNSGLENVVFGVYSKPILDKDGAVIGVEENSLIEKITTDKGGNATTSPLTPSTIIGIDEDGYTLYDENTCYYIKEISSAPGYGVSNITFGPLPAIESSNYVVEYTPNSPLAGNISLKKVQSNTSNGLSGATYGIYTDKDCTKLAKVDYYNESTAYDPNGKLADAILVTDANGNAVSGYLSAGTYYIKEISAPMNYTISFEVIEVTLGKGLPNPSIVLSDNLVIGSISIKKVDEKTGADVSGAKYGLFSDVDCKNIVETFSNTNEYGMTRLNNLTLGTYFVKEIEAPDGYNLNSTVYKVELKYKDQYTPVVYEYINTSNTRSEIIIEKVDENGNYLSNAQLKLVDTITNEEIVFTTSNKPEVINVVFGREYKLYELKAPDGYVLADTITFVAKPGEVVTMVDKKFVDPVTDVTISIKKIDENGNPVIGAILAIYDKNNNLVYTSEPTNENPIQISLLAGYVYRIEEILIPDGYMKAEDITFTATAGKEISLIDKTISYTVSKVDENKTLIKNAKLSVIDKNGNVIDEFISDGTPHLIKGLVYGESYTIKETEVPDGYKGSDDIAFTVDESNKNIYVINESISRYSDIEIVQTGDSTKVKYLITSIFISGLLLWGFFPKKEKLRLNK